MSPTVISHQQRGDPLLGFVKNFSCFWHWFYDLPSNVALNHTTDRILVS